MPSGFIAETDGTGRVEWVWRKGPGEKVARPVLDASAVSHELPTARCSGASVEAISDWFLKQARRKA